MSALSIGNILVYGTPDFAQYYNIQSYNNYNVTGNPTINNGIISNLDQLNYIYLPQKVQSISGFYSLNVHTIFKTSALAAASVVFGIGPYNLKLTVRSERQFWFQYRPLSAPNTLQSDKSNTMDIPLNTDLTVDLEYIKDTSAHLTIKNGDAVLWEDITTDITLTGNDDFMFGTDVLYFPGTYLSIDLNRTFVKVNNKYVFNGNQNYKELLWCNPKVYLQSSGTQYIDSGIYANSNLSNELVINFNGNNGQRLFGARKAYLQDAFALFYSNNLASTYGTSDFGYTIPFTKNIKNTIYRNKNKVFLNNELVQTDTEQSFTTNYPLYLFTVNQNGSVLTPNASSTKIYLSKIWNNGDTLIQHLVPVPEGLQIGSYKVPSNGMFDIVTQTFFENKGSGEFIWGVDL